jgi:hypothetical protein
MPLAPSVIFSFIERDVSGLILPGSTESASCTRETDSHRRFGNSVGVPAPRKLTLAELLLAKVKSYRTLVSLCWDLGCLHSHAHLCRGNLPLVAEQHLDLELDLGSPWRTVVGMMLEVLQFREEVVSCSG